jgi:hypothetical protein
MTQFHGTYAGTNSCGGAFDHEQVSSGTNRLAQAASRYVAVDVSCGRGPARDERVWVSFRYYLIALIAPSTRSFTWAGKSIRGDAGFYRSPRLARAGVRHGSVRRGTERGAHEILGRYHCGPVALEKSDGSGLLMRSNPNALNHLERHEN